MGNEIVIKQVKISFVLFFLLLFSFQINSQSYLITKYSTDNGLPDNRVNDIAQDSLGRIWIAMASGIAMYDGYEWTKFGEKDGVPEVEYTKIKVDEKGIIWFMPNKAWDNRLVYFSSERWSTILIASQNLKIPRGLFSIEVVYKNDKPEIFLSTHTLGILKYFKNEWTVLSKTQGLLSDTILCIDSDEEYFYASTTNGLYILKYLENDSLFIRYSLETSEKILSFLFINPAENSNNLTFLGLTEKKLLFKQSNAALSYFPIDVPILGIHISSTLARHPSGHIYFGNTSTLFSYNPTTNEIKRVLIEGKTKDRGASNIFIDYEGNLWLSSLRGIYKIKFTAFENLNKSSGLVDDEVTAISENKKGSLFFGHNYGITEYNSNKFNHYNLEELAYKRLKISRVMQIIENKNNERIYFSTYQNGVGTLLNGKISWTIVPGVSTYYYMSIDRNGIVYFITDIGLFKLTEYGYKIVNPSLKFLTRKLEFINDGSLMISNHTGLFRFKDNRLTIYKTNDLETNNIYTFNEIAEYGTLVGSIKGLFRLKDDSLIKFNFNEQDITDPIYFIIQDSSKNIWLGTNNGVLKWDGKYLKRYNKSDGLAGNETNRAAGFVDSKGNVWIGTDEGVSMYTGNEPDYFKFPPKVLLLNFRDHTNQSYNISKTVDVGPNNNNLIFNFRGLSFIDEKRNLFQIKLIEVNGDYQNEFTTKSTSARFNNLAPGDYIFSVRVQNSKGVWSEWKNSSLITVQDHFYNEPLFYLSVFGLLLFAAFTLNDYYQQKKYTKKLEKAVDERTKDLQETQKELLTTANRYKGIIESQTDLVIRITETGILTFVNDAYCAVFGKKPEDLLGKSFVPFVHPDDIDPTFEEIKKLRYPPYRSTIEQRDLTIDGYRWFSWEGYAILDKGGNVLEIQAVGRDITIQKEVEIELEKRVNQRTIELQSLISQSPLGILTFDSLGRMVTYNNVANDLFGSLKEYLMPSSDFNLLEDQFLMKNNYLESLKTLDSPNSFLLTNPILIDDLNNRIYKNLFNHFLVYRIYNIMLDEKNITYVLMLEDVTEQQMSEEVSKKLLEEKIRISTIIKTIESERDRVARELHDGLGQLLTTAKIKLDIIKLKTDKDLKEIDDTVNVLINAGDEIRRIINDLKPSDVESFGLISSIELLVERVRQSSGIKILLSVLSNIQFPDKNMELIIYRIIQEALNNTIKHSHCNKASIELLTINNELQIHIGDDGVGFDFSMFSEKFKSYGINNIKERVNSLNGKVEIETEPGKGFKYHIRIPL